MRDMRVLSGGTHTCRQRIPAEANLQIYLSPSLRPQSRHSFCGERTRGRAIARQGETSALAGARTIETGSGVGSPVDGRQQSGARGARTGALRPDDWWPYRPAVRAPPCEALSRCGGNRRNQQSSEPGRAYLKARSSRSRTFARSSRGNRRFPAHPPSAFRAQCLLPAARRLRRTRKRRGHTARS